jgi:hypothetical protein
MTYITDIACNKHYYFNFIIFYAGEINTPAYDVFAVGVAYL